MVINMNKEEYAEDLEVTVHNLEDKIRELEADRECFELKTDTAIVLCEYSADIISGAIEKVLGLNYDIGKLSNDSAFDSHKNLLQSGCKELTKYLGDALDNLTDQEDPFSEEQEDD